VAVLCEPATYLSWSGSIWPKARMVMTASIMPSTIEPESPMKIRAGDQLWHRNPRHMPIRTTETMAAGTIVLMS
jgi:hypothetical protein